MDSIKPKTDPAKSSLGTDTTREAMLRHILLTQEHILLMEWYDMNKKLAELKFGYKQIKCYFKKGLSTLPYGANTQEKQATSLQTTPKREEWHQVTISKGRYDFGNTTQNEKPGMSNAKAAALNLLATDEHSDIPAEGEYIYLHIWQ